mgnify:CR=1 FL=1
MNKTIFKVGDVVKRVCMGGDFPDRNMFKGYTYTISKIVNHMIILEEAPNPKGTHGGWRADNFILEKKKIHELWN